jgi:hypothetical protein
MWLLLLLLCAACQPLPLLLQALQCCGCCRVPVACLCMRPACCAWCIWVWHAPQVFSFGA